MNKHRNSSAGWFVSLVLIPGLAVSSSQIDRDEAALIDRDEAAFWEQQQERSHEIQEEAKDLLGDTGWLKYEIDPAEAEDGVRILHQAQENSAAAIEEFRGRIQQQGASGPREPTTEPLYALISMSLGETVVKDYFEQAAALDVPVVFVLRGFEPGNLQGLVTKILEWTAHEIEFQVHINPNLFRHNNIHRVPAFLYQPDDTDQARLRRGMASLHGALDSIAQSEELDLHIGSTYEIGEPDLLDWIEQRIQEVDWESHRREAIARAERHLTQGHASLPPALEQDSYLFDPTIQLQRDIHLPDGRLVAAAGTQVNPLDHVGLSNQYVIFDPSDPAQVRQAAEWKENGRRQSTLIATNLPEDPADIAALGERLGDHVHVLDDLIVRRMGLKAVPSRVKQEGRMVRVDVATPWVEENVYE